MKYLIHIFSMVLLMAQLNLSAQTDLIVDAEWFFDNDTAVGKNGILGINTPADSLSLNYSYITVPTSLGYGYHYLYIRTKSDTGKAWSQYEGRQFYIAPIVDYAEYFIDNDPGVGNGSPFTISNPNDSIIDSLLNISTNGLSLGRHYVFVRTHSTDGKWSQIQQSQEFYITNTVVKLEYFIDNDPGAGNGTQVNFTTASDSVVENISNISTTGLSTGKHFIYFRTYDDNGHWSMVESQSFFITNILASAEYFFDTDPGAGNGTPITINSPTDSNNINLSNISTSGLDFGTHFIYVRVKDSDGNWNIYEGKSFFITSTLARGEYFFDTDPGAGNGIEFTYAVQDSISENLTINTDSLSSGLHFVSVRTQDSQGKWGNIESRTFYINARVVQYKYWIDTIPAFAIGTVIDIPNNQWSDSINFSSTVSLACIDTGIHYLYISTKDDQDNWSIVQRDTFRVIPGSNIGLTHTIPGPGPNGTPLRLYGVGGSGANYRYRDVTHGGSFGVNNLFVIPNDSVVIFQVKDTCGNYSYDTITAPSAPTDLSTGGGSCTLVLNAYNQWVYIRDNNQKIIAAIKDNNQNLDTVYVEYISNTGSVRKEITNSYFYLDRNWRIHAKNNPTDSVEIKLYLTNAEFDSLNASDPTIDSIEQCQLTKYSGPNQNLDLDDNSIGGNNSVLIYPIYGTYTGNSTAGRYAQFKVKGFSEFYIGNGNNVPLPIQLLTFEVAKNQNDVAIDWKVANESNINSYIVERSTNSTDWIGIADITAKNEFSSIYTVIDKNAIDANVTNHLFYRLKQIEYSGTYTYSDIKHIYTSKEQNKVSIWPNPTTDVLHITISSTSKVGIYVYDITGKLVSEQTVNNINKNTSLTYNSEPLAKGIYTIVVKDLFTEQTQILRFEKL